MDNPQEQMVDVEYVGSKAKSTDNVAGTGTVWNGPGDVQKVPASAWPKLAKHAHWRLAGAAAAPTEPKKGIFGTNHPTENHIGGKSVQLGDLVRAAFAASQLNEDQWNALDDKDRHERVDAEIGKLKQAAERRAAAGDSEAAKLDAMEPEALHQLANQRGMRVHPQLGKPKLIKAILEHMGAQPA